jgi:hypothetical protein
MNEVPRRQFAAAYRHPKFLIVETWSGLRSAAFDPEGAQHLLPADSGAAELVAANGLKTKRALFKDLDYGEITLADSKIAFTPKHHVKLEAWEEVRGIADVTVGADNAPEEIGISLRRAFERCTQA